MNCRRESKRNCYSAGRGHSYLIGDLRKVRAFIRHRSVNIGAVYGDRISLAERTSSRHLRKLIAASAAFGLKTGAALAGLSVRLQPVFGAVKRLGYAR
jgi:hypothetical protein